VEVRETFGGAFVPKSKEQYWILWPFLSRGRTEIVYGVTAKGATRKEFKSF